MRIFFATDVHGSETCWRKFLHAGAHYKADALILDGENWHATLLENRRNLVGEDQVREFEEAVIRRGYYPFRTNPDALQLLHENEAHWHGLFEEKMLETVKKWMDLADERLS